MNVSPGSITGTQPGCRPLVIGPVDRRKGPSREIEQANTHNEAEHYPRTAGRVKTICRAGPHRAPALTERYRARCTRRSSQTGSRVSRTTPSEPKTR
ncbi:hypothetical protein SSCG_03891 [Streptomyces clavuligerus]|nr:hypothetical protein SSCG_03891 [Streptomyces clavuligerus]